MALRHKGGHSDGQSQIATLKRGHTASRQRDHAAVSKTGFAQFSAEQRAATPLAPGLVMTHRRAFSAYFGACWGSSAAGAGTGTVLIALAGDPLMSFELIAR